MPDSFREAVSAPDNRINLAEAALWIARDTYPRLNIEEYLVQLYDMAAPVARSLRWDQRRNTSPERRVVLSRLNDYLFGELGFRGNRENYYDPRNSYFNEVLDRRIGIPITLSLVYLEIAWRIGLPLAGVGLPAHFMVTWIGPGDPLLIDPFEGGALLDVEACRERLSEMAGRRITLSSDWLRPVSRPYILTRMLLNLKGAAAQAGQFDQAIRASEKLLILRPDTPDEVRDLGLLHTQAGHCWEALRYLTEYTTMLPDAPDAEQVVQLSNALFEQVAGEAKD